MLMNAPLCSRCLLGLTLLVLTGCGRKPGPLEQGMAALEQQDYDAAIAFFNQVIEANPNDAATLVRRAQAYSVKGDPTAALASYDAALRLEPNNAPTYLSRAYAHRQLRNFAQAIADCTTALRLDPENATAYTSRGIAYHEAGDYDKAIADYDEAIRRGATEVAVYLSRGIAQHEAGAYDKAIADFSEAIRREPNNSGAYNNRALSHRKKGAIAAAIADYEMSIKLDRTSGYGYAGLAWIWATAIDPALRDGTKAVSYAQKGCELTGWTHPYCLSVLAAAYAETGRFDQAVRWQQRALDFAATFPKGEADKAAFRLKLYQARQPYRE
jgi:tetratricopeptide (TPR) repeat protein